jgi:phosphoenolpyruvate carboxykinase (ATP)
VKDTYTVAWPEVVDQIWWKADMQQYDPEKYQGLLKRVLDHLNNKNATLYVKDVFVGADASFAIPYRFVGEYATHAIFAENMFVKNLQGVKDVDARRWTMINAPSFICEPARDGCRAEAALAIDMRNRICLVAGRADYCGTVKKTIFTVGNFLFPLDDRLSMHCSANVGANGDAAILFGLSGTGKTTLSADPDRRLIGDDETIWSDSGLCNLEDGCYAKLIDLDKDAEPVIASALSEPGTVIENVPPLKSKPLSETDPQELDLYDGSITENTRFSYPLSANPNVMPNAQGPHPSTIVLLTADAFGCAAAGLDSRRQTGHVPLRIGLYRQARRHRGGCHRAAGGVQRLLRRARSWRTSRASMRSCCTRKWKSTRRAASCSTPAGAEAALEPASASRSRTRARC